MSDFRKLSLPEQIAEHYLAHYEGIGPQSRKELCGLYDCSEATLRTSMKTCVKPRLRAMGMAMLMPEGRNAWRVIPISELRVWRHSVLPRLSAVINELRGYKADELALAGEGDRHHFDDLLVAVEMVHEALVAAGEAE